METLVIGSTVVDVVLRVPALPRTGEDLNILGQTLSLGGCAFNVYHTLALFGAPALLCSPVGGGLYGGFVRRELARRRIATGLPQVAQPNGCCYCLVDPSGERTFLCSRGAEYVFRREWLQALPQAESAYVCGLELEEDSGEELLGFLEERRFPRLYFAPGPRIASLPPRRLERLFALHPLLHLNEGEALGYTGAASLAQAGRALQQQTGRSVVITLGSRGAYVRCGQKEKILPGEPARAVDTIGAGDSHIGAVIACCEQGMDLERAVARANRVARAVVQQPSALLPQADFSALFEGENEKD